MDGYQNKRLSLDHNQTRNEGASLRNPWNVDDDSEATSSVIDSLDGFENEAPLAPRYAQASSSMKPTESYHRSTSSLNSRVSSIDQHLEKTLTNIKSMSLMFESGGLQSPAIVRPSSLISVDVASNTASRAVVVPVAPPARNSSSSQRANAQHSPEHHAPVRSAVQSSGSPASFAPSEATHSYVKDLEHRVEQLEEMLATMQQRLDAVLASHESTKIPSKHDPAPRRINHGAHANSHSIASELAVHELAINSIGPGASAASATVLDSHQGQSTDRSGPSTSRSSIVSSGRRHSLAGAAHTIIFARRLQLPDIAYLPTFDSAVCSKGITLLNNNTAATLMQFYNAPHPYCLGPVITRGASMQTITLYFGQPALPAMNDSSSSANLQAILRNGSTDETMQAIISSTPDDLCKSLNEAALAALSKQFAVVFRRDQDFLVRCSLLRKRCVDIALDAARGGVCFFGICGANVPSHGIRGNEIVWCSSLNERKEPGAQKTKPLMNRTDMMRCLDTHIKLLHTDMITVCEAYPEIGNMINDLLAGRRTVERAVDDKSSSLQNAPNPWTLNHLGLKQLHDMLVGPKALPKTFPVWPKKLWNMFVIRGISDNSEELDRTLAEINDLQTALVEHLESLAPNRRQAVLLPREIFDEETEQKTELLPLLPVITKIEVHMDGLSLMQSRESLKDPKDPKDPKVHYQPLMSEDGRLLLLSDSDSRPSSVYGSRHSSSQHLSPRESTDLHTYQGPAAFVKFEMQAMDELVRLCGDDKHLPVHPSIGISRPNQQYSDANTTKAKKKINMHPVLTSTGVPVSFPNPGQVEGLKAFVEGTLAELRSMYKSLQDLSEQPGQLYLLKDTFYMENFMHELNTNYLPHSDALQFPSKPIESDPSKKSETVISISLSQDIKEITGKVIFAANQFYTMRLVNEESFKLYAPSGAQVTTLRDISEDVATKLGLCIMSIKRSTPLSRTSMKTGKIQEQPSVVIPWMPGQRDQLSERRQLGCGTFGPGSIVTIKLDAPRKRLWLSNGVSGSGNVQGIPSEEDIFSREFSLVDFAVIRPFVAFSSKFQNVQLMPELPPIITDIYKKFLSLESRLIDLTAEFSEVGGSNSLIAFGFSSNFLARNAENSDEYDIEQAQNNIMSRFREYSGVSEAYKYLNFKIFNLYVKESDKVEQVCKIEFTSMGALQAASELQTLDSRVLKLEKAELDRIHRDNSVAVDYCITEEIEKSDSLIFRPTGAVERLQDLIELIQAKFSTTVSQSASSSKKSKIQIVAFNDPKASASRLQSFKVIFEDLESSQHAMEEFQEDASLVDDSSAFAKAFTADFYVNTEAEVIALAAESWQQFKAKAKQIVLAHNALQEHYSTCESAPGYASAFAPILNQAKKRLSQCLEVVKGLCAHMQDLH